MNNQKSKKERESILAKLLDIKVERCVMDAVATAAIGINELSKDMTRNFDIPAGKLLFALELAFSIGHQRGQESMEHHISG